MSKIKASLFRPFYRHIVRGSPCPKGLTIQLVKRDKMDEGKLRHSAGK